MTLLTIVEFVVALVAILIGAAFFTNAVEILGSRLGMGQGAVGSLLAAVGTALPESMIAIVAILEPAGPRARRWARTARRSGAT
jgi:cation:H+ antiporter